MVFALQNSFTPGNMYPRTKPPLASSTTCLVDPEYFEWESDFRIVQKEHLFLVTNNSTRMYVSVRPFILGFGKGNCSYLVSGKGAQ